MITNLRMELFEALITILYYLVGPGVVVQQAPALLVLQHVGVLLVNAEAAVAVACTHICHDHDDTGRVLHDDRLGQQYYFAELRYSFQQLSVLCCKMARVRLQGLTTLRE